MGHTEHAGEFGFEVAERAKGGFGGIEVVESALEQIMQGCIGVFGLHGRFEELAKIGGEERGGIIPPQSLTPIANRDLAKRVEIASTRSGEGDFAAEKEIDLSLEGAFRATGTFCHRLDQALGLREPMHNEAGFRQPGGSGHDGISGLHCGRLAEVFRKTTLILSSDAADSRFRGDPFPRGPPPGKCFLDRGKMKKSENSAEMVR